MQTIVNILPKFDKLLTNLKRIFGADDSAATAWRRARCAATAALPSSPRSARLAADISRNSKSKCKLPATYQHKMQPN